MKPVRKAKKEEFWDYRRQRESALERDAEGKSVSLIGQRTRYLNSGKVDTRDSRRIHARLAYQMQSFLRFPPARYIKDKNKLISLAVSEGKKLIQVASQFENVKGGMKFNYEV